MAIQLEYRIAKTHVGPGKIDTPAKIQTRNKYWSYARHLPPDWDVSKAEKRTAVASRLFTELVVFGSKESPLDISALKDDQRVSGTVYGGNPLKSMMNVIAELSKAHPEYPFFAKWGGYEPLQEGKRFVFYVEDEADAALMMGRVREAAGRAGAQVTVSHEFGITHYKSHLDIDANFRSVVRGREEFADLLGGLVGFPHFFHELFV
ncbi:MAG: hypothetical protein AB1324_02990 [Candidatus Micrarchaeota archaeon]